MDDKGNPEGGADAKPEPFKLELTPEERAIMLQCRRQAMIRGNTP
jgi:hypothetical protein